MYSNLEKHMGEGGPIEYMAKFTPGPGRKHSEALPPLPEGGKWRGILIQTFLLTLPMGLRGRIAKFVIDLRVRGSHLPTHSLESIICGLPAGGGSIPVQNAKKINKN